MGYLKGKDTFSIIDGTSEHAPVRPSNSSQPPWLHVAGLPKLADCFLFLSRPISLETGNKVHGH